MTRTLAVLAGTYGVLMGVSPLLQVRRMVARRSSSDISIGYFGVLAAGFGLWLAYGISIGNAPLIVTNVVAIMVALVTISVARMYRRQQSGPA